MAYQRQTGVHLNANVGVVFVQLKKEARSIYDTFLSESSLHAVNIDDTAQTEENSLETPTPDMFDKAQQQVRTPAACCVCDQLSEIEMSH